MPMSITDKYNLNKAEFAETGAFDVILDVDSRLFIDPALLEKCDIPEFVGSKEKAEKYFSGIITLLSHSTSRTDMYWKRADKMLSFKEMTGTCFGYTKSGTAGNSIGKNLRTVVLSTIKELVEKGEKDPTLFELLGVFQENIGCDRISDMLTFILAENILAFTQRVLQQFGLTNFTVKYGEKEYMSCLNQYNGKAVLLIPSSILSPLPVADSYDDIDRICSENERVRQEINSYFEFENDKKKLSKSQIHQLMKERPSFRAALIAAYKSADHLPYDFENDPVGEYAWYEVAKQYCADYPMELQLPSNPSVSDVFTIVWQICEQFKSLIEDNGLWQLLYDDKGKQKHERAAQLLFFGIADSYCTANDIDLSRENNNGRGAIDFKLSRGAKDKVLVEVKLTSNKQLLHGITGQIPIYLKQEKTQKAVYLVIDIGAGHENALKGMYKCINSLSLEEKQKIKLKVIDATPSRSASTV